MIVTHELIVLARCPVDNQVDEYTCTVETDRTIFVELILATAANSFAGGPAVAAEPTARSPPPANEC